MLTFAGQELIFPTPELEAWILENQDLSDLSPFSEQRADVLSARHACRSRGEQTKGLALPVPNWPPPPPVRLNTLWWPTGATRWARGYFLATQTVRDKIVSQLADENGVIAGTLRLGDDSGGDALAIDMYMLPPRPMSCSSEGEKLHVIPLVDERYFWQFAPAVNSGGDPITVTTSTSWTSLIGDLAFALGMDVTVEATIESAYLKPDPTDFTRPWDNAALILDAVAASVGRRIVRRIDGTVRLESRSAADDSLSGNLDLEYQQLAGGDFSILRGDLPAKVVVAFRKIKQYLLQQDGQRYTVEKSPESAVGTVKNRKLLIHCAAYADYDTSDVLQNSAALDALAAQISTDFYGWASKDYDHTFAGIVPWLPTGYDDSILWTFGRLSAIEQYELERDKEDGSAVGIRCSRDLLAQTRVQTLPPNFWAEINLASDSTKEIVEPRLMAKANADISPGGTGAVSLFDSFSHDTGKDVTLTNIAGSTWSSGKRGWAEGIGDAVWLGSPAEC